MPQEHKSIFRSVVSSLLQPAVRSASGLVRARIDEEISRRMPKATLYDPTGFLETLQYKEKPSNLTYDLLRLLAQKSSVVASIVNARCNQVAEFARPYEHSPSKLGYRILHRDRRDKMNRAEQREADRIEEFILHCGLGDDPWKTSFEMFLRALIRDRLILDQACFEIVPALNGKPYAFLAVDGATIRYAAEMYGEKGRTTARDDRQIAYRQVVDMTVYNEFSRDELAFLIANPRTDIYSWGYGFSEVEQAVYLITNHLFAEEYNSRFFRQGTAIKGLLNFKDDNMDREKLDAFRREWQMMVSGVINAWRTPIMNAKDVQWISMHSTNREMEFAKWLEYLVNGVAGIFQIDPVELNYPNHAGPSGVAPAFESRGENRLKSSKDKGLRPLLHWAETGLNKHIVERLNPDFVLVLQGLDVEDDAAMADLLGKKTQTIMTINEARSLQGLSPLEDGDMIRDPTYMQYHQAQQQMRDAKKQGAAGAGAGGPGVPPGGPGMQPPPDGMPGQPGPGAAPQPAGMSPNAELTQPPSIPLSPQEQGGAQIGPPGSPMMKSRKVTYRIQVVD